MAVMPSAPTVRMRTLAARWLTDRVVLSEVTYPTDTRPLGKATTTVTGLPLRTDTGEVLTDDDGEILVADDPSELRALIRSEVVELVDSQNVRRDVRQLRVWIDDDGDAAAGQRMTITVCGDETLVGRFGQVISVERDSIRAVRRITVRLANDD